MLISKREKGLIPGLGASNVLMAPSSHLGTGRDVKLWMVTAEQCFSLGC